jgi:hypothetical protein
MKILSVMAANATLVLSAATASAAELPSYELTGFPITPHQFSVVGSANVKEQSPSPSLTMGAMPASPHQVAVLTPRQKLIEELATLNPLPDSSFSDR